MRTVLGRTAGRVSLILVSAGVVGSAALPAVPAVAGAATHQHVAVEPSPAPAGHRTAPAATRIGSAVKYVRQPDGSVRKVRG